MARVIKWITRTSIAMLAAVSVSAFAAAPGAPDFLMHKATVKFKVSRDAGGNIANETIKTKEVINILMHRAPDAKNEKNEKLGLVTGCDRDVDAAALVVYDTKLEIIKPLSDEIVIFVQSEVFETKDGQLQKVDLLGEINDDDAFIDITGQIKYGKIGKKAADDTWDKDANCPRKFSSKSINGLALVGGELFIGGDVIMSGKLKAGKPQFAADFKFPGEVAAMSIVKTNNIGGDLIEFPAVFPIEIEYQVAVQNIGNVPLTGVTVTDTSLTSALVCGGQIGFDGTLGRNESTFCVGDRVINEAEYLAICAFEDGIIGPGAIINIAVANSDQSDAFDTDNVIRLECFPDPPPNLPDELGIIKEADRAFARIGETITYNIRVVNIGSILQTEVEVTDVRPDVVVDCGNFNGTLSVFEGINCTATLDVTPEVVAAACETNGAGIRNVALVSSLQTRPLFFPADEFVLVDCPR